MKKILGVLVLGMLATASWGQEKKIVTEKTLKPMHKVCYDRIHTAQKSSGNYDKNDSNLANIVEGCKKQALMIYKRKHNIP